MRVRVNGEAKDVTAQRIDALLGELEYEGAHFAIALNYDVVPKSRWAETSLKDGDEIEIITPRQGGCWVASAGTSLLTLAPLFAGRGRRAAPGEGLSPRVQLSPALRQEPLTPTLS